MSYAQRWKALPAELVVIFTIPAEARPYSAVKLFVKTLNSWTDSKGTCCPSVPTNSSLFAAPSRRIFVDAARRPLITTPAPSTVLTPICPEGAASMATRLQERVAQLDG